MKKLAVLLLNLGGPLEQNDVRGFLFNLFSDKFIIGLPFGLRHALAALISTTRAKSARANYALMGGGSGIVFETNAQAQALSARLKTDFSDYETKVFVGMRYWHPYIGDTVKDIERFSPDEIVFLPLYPQFSSTTTLSAINEFQSCYKGQALVKYVCCYAQNPSFIEAHIEIIKDGLAKLNQGNRRILFSAHGLPEKIIQGGDPYAEQVEACVSRIMKHFDGEDFQICYQSKVGPLKWIGPSTDDCIRGAGELAKEILVVPIAFVSEHIETLVELDMEYAELAKHSGVKNYVRVPTLRTQPNFIKALSEEVRAAISSNQDIIGDHNCAPCHGFCPKKRGRI